MIGLERQHIHCGAFVPKPTRFQSWTRFFDKETLLENTNFEMRIINKIDSSPHVIQNAEWRLRLVVSNAHPERVCFEKEFDCVGQHVDLQKRNVLRAVPEANAARKRPEVRLFEWNRCIKSPPNRTYIRIESSRVGDERTCCWAARHRCESGARNRREGERYILRGEWIRFGVKELWFARFCQIERKTREEKGRVGFRGDSRTIGDPGSFRKREKRNGERFEDALSGIAS